MPVARMLNTCSIGRRWKPREGWSRPVLTGERGTLFPTRLLGRVSSCGGFFRWMARSIVSCGHDDDTGEAFGCSRPLSGSRTATIGIGRVAWFRFCRPILVVGRYIGFAVVMAQVRRPVPFRTRKLRPGRGDGTALERVWESSAPPHSTLGVPVELRLREPPFFLFVVPACRLEPGPRGFRANGQRKLLDFSPCVSYVKALRLVLWQELRCMTLQRRRVCLPRRSPSPSGIPTK